MANSKFRWTNGIGILSVVGASVFFSLNDAMVKFLSGDYALHQVVLIRSLIGLVLLLGAIVPLQGGYHLLRTNRLGAHLFRGTCVVFANMCFYLGLSALPLAEVVAIFFVSPLIITTFSVLFLKEHVGPHRWAAVGIGLIGVLIVIRPGTQAFQLASLWPIAAAFWYAFLHVMTRRIGNTESPTTMTFYIILVFLFVSLAIGLSIGDGKFAGLGGTSLNFLFRPWSQPKSGDYGLFLLLGLCGTLGGYLISQAYRICQAALIAPFEYVALPLSILFGIVFFGEWPDATAWIGSVLILLGGLYLFLREARNNPMPGHHPAQGQSGTT